MLSQYSLSIYSMRFTHQLFWLDQSIKLQKQGAYLIMQYQNNYDIHAYMYFIQLHNYFNSMNSRKL